MSTYRVTIKYWDRHYGDGHVQFKRNFEARRSTKADQAAIDALEEGIRLHPKPQGREAQAWAERSDPREGPGTLRAYDGSSGTWVRVEPRRIAPTKARETRYPKLPEPKRHFVSPRARAASHRVADFNTLDDLVAHARQEGATYVLQIDDETHLYFQRKDGSYEKSEVWQKDGYWHTQGPGSRVIVRRPPENAKPIAGAPRGRTVRDYIAVDPRDRQVAGPFKSYSDARQEADQAGGVVKFVPAGKGQSGVSEARDPGRSAHRRLSRTRR